MKGSTNTAPMSMKLTNSLSLKSISRRSLVLLQSISTNSIRTNRLTLHGCLFIILLASFVTYQPNKLLGQELKLRYPSGHAQKVVAESVSPDGQHIATAGDLTIKLWEASSGRVISNLATYRRNSASVDFSQSGELLLMAGDSIASLWSFRTGKAMDQFPHKEDLDEALFVSNDEYILARSIHGPSYLWSIKRQKVKKFEHYKGFPLQYNASKEQLGVYSEKGFGIWDIPTGRWVYKSKEEEIRSFEFSPNLKNVLILKKDSTLRMINLTSKRDVFETKVNHRIGYYNSINFDDSGEFFKIEYHGGSASYHIMSGGKKSKIELIDRGVDSKSMQSWKNTGRRAKEDKTLHNFRDRTTYHSDLIKTEDNRVFLRWNHKTPVTWNANTGQFSKLLVGHDKMIETMDINNHGLVATGSQDKTAKVWDVKKGELLHSLEGSLNTIKEVKFNPRGDWLLTNAYDHTVKIWDVKTGQIKHRLRAGKKYSYLKSHFVQDGKFVVTVNSLKNRSCMIWQVDGKYPKPLIEIDSIKSILIAQNQQFLVAKTNDNSFSTWEITTGKKQKEWKFDFLLIESFSLSPDDRYLQLKVKLSDIESAYMIWDIEKEIFFNQIDNLSHFKLATFSPDGDLLASASVTDNFEDENDQYPISTVQVLRMNQKEPLKYLEFKRREALSFQFSPNQRYLALHLLNPYSQEISAESDFIEDILNIRFFDFEKDNFIDEKLLTDDRIIDYRFSKSGSYLFLMTSRNKLILYDLKRQAVKYRLPQFYGTLRSLIILEENGFASLTDGDGRTSLIDLDKGALVLTQVVIDKDPEKWIHLGANGFFDASAKAMELLYWTKGLKVIDFDVHKDEYYQPDLWENTISRKVN